MPSKAAVRDVSPAKSDEELRRLCGADRAETLGADGLLYKVRVWREEYLARRQPARNPYGEVIADEVARWAFQSVSAGLSHAETAQCVVLLSEALVDALKAEAA